MKTSTLCSVLLKKNNHASWLIRSVDGAKTSDNLPLFQAWFRNQIPEDFRVTCHEEKDPNVWKEIKEMQSIWVPLIAAFQWIVCKCYLLKLFDYSVLQT